MLNSLTVAARAELLNGFQRRFAGHFRSAQHPQQVERTPPLTAAGSGILRNDANLLTGEDHVHRSSRQFRHRVGNAAVGAAGPRRRQRDGNRSILRRRAFRRAGCRFARLQRTLE